MVRKTLLATAFGVGALLWLNTGAAAFGPYTGGTVGYDVSYPQCTSTSSPNGRFGIVGVNGGRPFNYNSCFASEYAKAPTGSASIYINTGYDLAYTAVDGMHTTPDCQTRSASVPGTPDQQAAWGVGCSEAERDIAAAGQAAPTAWWLDVEVANSWSTDPALNQYTVNGIVDTLRPQLTPIGVYSTPQQWTTIMGGLQVHVDADWVATGQRSLKRAKASCGPTGFSGAPIWLVQYVTTIDNDYAC